MQHAFGGCYITLAGVRVEFPKPSPYSSQRVMMEKTIKALTHSKSALLESPTGSGKSLALLCAALAFQRKQFEQEALSFDKTEGSGDCCRDEGSVSFEAACGAGGGAGGVLHAGNRSGQKKSAIETTEGDRLSRLESLKSKEVDTGTEDTSKSKKCVKRSVPRVYFASRTHAQIAQLIKELRSTSYQPSISVLGSREHYCVHPQVSKSSSKSEECKKHMDAQSCAYANGAARLRNHDSLQQPDGSSAIWDIEDIVSLGKKVRGCPYFASRAMAQEADLVFCPYNYLVDPIVRSSMDIQLDGACVILDEAHNIEDACREAASLLIDYDALQEGAGECSAFTTTIHKEVFDPLALLLHNLAGWVHARKDELVKLEFTVSSKEYNGRAGVDMLGSLGVTPLTLPLLTEHLNNAAVVASEDETGLFAGVGKALQLVEKLLSILGFIFQDNCKYANDYRFVVMEQTQRVMGPNGRFTTELKLQFALWCLNPAVAFEALGSQCRSVIVTSGTLAPMDSFASELGTEFPIRVECPHIIDIKKQLWVGAVSHAPNGVELKTVFKNTDSLVFQDAVGETILQYCSIIPHGVLCFFPSYSTLERFHTRWEASGLLSRLQKLKLVIAEPRGTGEAFEQAMLAYNDAVDTSNRAASRESPENNKETTVSGKGGALFLAVCRGKVSEGMDFSDHHARGVLVVGIPYPAFKDRQVVLKKEWNNRKLSCAGAGCLSGNDWYSLQAFRALNQAVGRCIRHVSDYGAIVLLDTRFQDPNAAPRLSRWLRSALQNYKNVSDTMPLLQTFFQNLREKKQATPRNVVTSACVTSSCVTSSLPEDLAMDDTAVQGPFDSEALRNVAPVCQSRAKRTIKGLAPQPLPDCLTLKRITDKASGSIGSSCASEVVDHASSSQLLICLKCGVTLLRQENVMRKQVMLTCLSTTTAIGGTRSTDAFIITPEDAESKKTTVVHDRNMGLSDEIIWVQEELVAFRQVYCKHCGPLNDRLGGLIVAASREHGHLLDCTIIPTHTVQYVDRGDVQFASLVCEELIAEEVSATEVTSGQAPAAEHLQTPRVYRSATQAKENVAIAATKVQLHPKANISSAALLVSTCAPTSDSRFKNLQTSVESPAMVDHGDKYFREHKTRPTPRAANGGRRDHVTQVAFMDDDSDDDFQTDTSRSGKRKDAAGLKRRRRG